jgi:hypothetical protein
MKIFLCLYFILLSAAYATTQSSDSDSLATAKLKFCLASIYTAETSAYMENKTYSDNINYLNIGSFCESINPIITLKGKKHFTAQGEVEGESWTINESKELMKVE